MYEFSANTQSALEILRNPQQTMQWYIIPVFLIFLYIVFKELSEKHYKVVLAGAALWLVDIFNEIWNSYVCFISHQAPVWGTPANVGDTSLLILIGYNIEISIMFFIMGMAVVLSLPEDKKKKIFGINNRVLFAVVLTTCAVLVECFLNYAGILTWEWSWWQRKFPFVLWIIGYLPFFSAAFYAYDRPTLKGSLKFVGGLAAMDAVLLIVGAVMHWI